MSLLSKYPDVCKEWDFIENPTLPSDYLPYSNKKVWWVCEYGHKWNAVISSRTRNNSKCPICFRNESWCENYIFSVLNQKYKIVKHVNPEIDIYLIDLNIGIEYDGYYHKFRVDSDNNKNKWCSENLSLLIRVREKYLPSLDYVEGIMSIIQSDSSKESCKSSLFQIFKILGCDEKEFDMDVVVESRIRNYDIPKKISDSWSHRNKMVISKALKTHKYFWICDVCESEYESTLRNRLKGTKCTFCCSQKVNETNRLSSTHGYLIEYISLNNELDPSSITYGTSKKIRFNLNSKEYYTTPRNFNRFFKSN